MFSLADCSMFCRIFSVLVIVFIILLRITVASDQSFGRNKLLDFQTFTVIFIVVVLCVRANSFALLEKILLKSLA